MKLKINMKELTFYVAIVFFYTQYIFGTSNLSNILGIPINYFCGCLKYASIILACIKIVIYTRFTKKQYLFLVFFFCIAIVSFLNSSSIYIFYFTLFIIAAKDMNYTKICKTIILTAVPSIVYIVIMSLLGKVGDSLIVEGYNVITKTYVTRRSFGFQHINFLGGNALLLFMSIIYIRYDKYCWKDFLGTIVIITILIVVVFTKTAALLILIISLLVLFEKVIGKFNKKVINITIFCIIIMSLLLTFIFSCIYDEYNIFHRYINKVLSGRLYYNNYFLTNYDVKLFGQNIEFISSIEAIKNHTKALVLDNAFLYLLYVYGIIEFCLVIGIYLKLFNRYKDKKFCICICIAGLFICGISEKWLFMLQFNPIPLLLFADSDEEIKKSN